ncbi:hypothetical protein FQA39_LY14525 [Lamprigera yunnana]|nr:hypothetical protein FQA39_LY14525 [Lamprigera yunnana]
MPFIFKHGGRNIDLKSLGTDELFELIEEIPTGSEGELDDDIDNLDDIDTHSNSGNENVLEDNVDEPYVLDAPENSNLIMVKNEVSDTAVGNSNSAGSSNCQNLSKKKNGTFNVRVEPKGVSQRYIKDLKEDEGSASEFLHRNNLSSPEQCARTCTGGPPKKCYYKFYLEQYNVQGLACTACRSNGTNVCQCILADGVERSAYTVNRLIPGPPIEVCENDTVIVDVKNNIPGSSVTIHWHGILQREYILLRCFYHGDCRSARPSSKELLGKFDFGFACIGDGHFEACLWFHLEVHYDLSFRLIIVGRYKWRASEIGTHFWHSHSGFQKMDGLTGRIIVRGQKSNDPHRLLYNYDLSEHVIFLQDWVHAYGQEKFPGGTSSKLRTLPDNILVNGKGKYKNLTTNTYTSVPLEVFNVDNNYNYRFRLINAFVSMCPAQISIEKHRLTVIATDGHPIEPIVVDSIISVSAERFDFIITANQSQGGAYWIQIKLLAECKSLKMQQLAILQYSTGPTTTSSSQPTYDLSLPLGKVLNPLDTRCDQSREDAICINQLHGVEIKHPKALKTEPDVKIFLPFSFYSHSPDTLFTSNSYERFFVPTEMGAVSGLLDNITFSSPPSPLLSQYADLDPRHFCNGDQNIVNCGITCKCTHIIQIPLNSVVEMILVDEVHLGDVHHPFHLHGFSYYVLGLGKMPIPGKNITLSEAVRLDEQKLLRRSFHKPPSKDTVMIPVNGYVVLRFIADNVGFWFFHCHYLFHLITGMSAVFQVGEVSEMPPPPDGFPKCGNFIPKV